MADRPDGLPERLDSWKEIAGYLRRDAGTVRRWEKELGLPVRRLPGRGRSVFAYRSEIDAWLAMPRASEAAATGSDVGVAVSRARWVAWSGAAVMLAALSLAAWRFAGPRVRAEDLRVDVTEKEVIVSDREGTARWRYGFPATHNVGLPFTAPAGLVVGGRAPGVYVATENHIRYEDKQEEGGQLRWFDLDGHLKRSFSLTDTVTFNGTTYAPPWAIQHFSVDERGGTRRIALAAHHHVWSASLVTVLDDQWRRRGTFWHYGWIEAAHWIAPNRLLAAGFSNAHDGGMIALLDPGALDGQGPEPPGTEGHCDTCGSGAAIRMVVMPRSEVNGLTVSRFNRAVVQIAPDRILARTYEMWSPNEVIDALYEFTPALDLLKASYSERYWEMHLALERQGVITHSREKCADRDSPRAIKVWEPEPGWRTMKIAR